MGVAALRRIQAGLETTRGTAVAATAKWMGMMVEADLGDRPVVQPEDERASLAMAHRSYIPFVLWDSKISGNVTFEDLPFLLQMAIVGAVTPTIPVGTVRLWTFAPSLTVAQNPATYTVEFGDDVQAYEAEYCFLKDLEIGATLDDVLKFNAGLVGRQLTATTFTASLADRTVRDALAAKTRLWMDDTGGTIGTTAQAATLLDWTWKLPQHFVPKRHQDGNLYFSNHSELKMRPELDLTVEFIAGVATLRTKYLAETRQLVRLRSTGSNIEGAHDREVTIDGAYKITNFEQLDERNGATIVQMHLVGEYDTTWAKLFEVIVRNSVAALP
jgi:hypothetical protein